MRACHSVLASSGVRKRASKQKRRRGALDHLVRVMVEGDDRWSSGASSRLGSQVLQEIHMATMQAVEHADHDEQPPMVRA